MWFQRLTKLLAAPERPSLLLGGEPYGTPFLLDRLARTRPFAWAVLGPQHRGDPVAQGNALATALNRATGGTLFPGALDFRYHLQLLALHRTNLAPLGLALSGAEFAPEMAAGLIELHGTGYVVLLDCTEPPDPIRADLLRLGPAELSLSWEEAVAITPRGVEEAAARAALEASGGRFMDFLRLVNSYANLPAPALPYPEGRRLAHEDASLEEPEHVVVALQRMGRHLEALEVAVMAAPHLAEEVLAAAGPAYQENGLLKRLHLLLSALPEPYRGSERALEWRLVAAVATGEVREVRGEVDEYLRNHSAPELRARRAGITRGEEGRELARQAFEARRTPLTVWQYGRMHPDLFTGGELLQESVALAEEEGTPYELARSAGTLAERLYNLGEYQRSTAWGRWALQVFDENGLKDGNRRLRIFNTLAASRILLGDVAGLRPTLDEAQAALEGIAPDLAAAFRSTCAWLDLAVGRAAAALESTAGAYAKASRHEKGRFAYQLVRALLETGEAVEAERVARTAVELTRDLGEAERALAELALGMALAWQGDSAALPHLVRVAHLEQLSMEQRLTAGLHLLLLADGAPDRLPAELRERLLALPDTGLRVLSGPQARFERVWKGLSTQAPDLRLNALGEPGAFLAGEPLELPLRLWELTLALALNPDGVSSEQLHLFVAGDRGRPTPGTIRSHLARLRGILPISDPPYRFTVPYSLDVTELRDRLRNGLIREATALLRGPLLPGSDAPGVEETRALVEDELREATLGSGDAEALIELAERLRDDLELWEATLAELPTNDPRHALARARVRRLQREFGIDTS